MEQESQKIIKINYGEEDFFNFNAISPNIEEFVKWLVDNNYLVADKFTIDSDIEEFDKATFKEIIKEFIIEFSRSLNLEQINFEKAMSLINEDPSPES